MSEREDEWITFYLLKKKPDILVDGIMGKLGYSLVALYIVSRLQYMQMASEPAKKS